jgi:ADP-ribosyl-[dinitrogen reductase] hydrolase
VRGSLLGGAVGDALRAPVEFMKLTEIEQKFRTKEIQNFSPAYGKLGAITDDTQMTMFNAEGMLRWESRLRDHGMASHEACMGHAYLRRLRTLGEFTDKPPKFDCPGWLYNVPGLHRRRGPGATCLSSLREMEVENLEFTNTSKGCGGVMRAAPCGLFDKFPIEYCYDFGRDGAKLTHHHPEGFVSAGVLALLIGAIREDATLRDAAERALGAAALRRADFAAGVRVAVNHDGDSDSTGTICGNILGASLGVQAIPHDWLSALELRDAITQLADDMVTRFREGRGWMQAYPPN